MDVSHFITTSQNHPLLRCPDSCFRFILLQTKDQRPVLGFHGCSEKTQGMKRHFADVVAEWEKLNPNLLIIPEEGENTFLHYTWTRKRVAIKKE